MKTICTFFGHRNTNEIIFNDLYDAVKHTILEDGVTTFYVGGYGSFDGMSARAVRQAKKEFEGLELYLVLAYLPTEKDEYIERNFDGTIYAEGLETVPQRFAISHRNRWMVQQSDVVIGCISKSYGGAYTAFHYAENQGKKTINLKENRR
ncbi:hypothetical protein RFF05_03885 [Bengtsoniella intestinalis]|uniref:hypothetical protein n=1 Tax=Bengtsoniella intestinalis TaxID=3073143 RepID=UPI00391F7E7C